VAGRALGVAAKRVKSIVFRALDYLPPGEISFADYGRAIIAADQASHPEPSLEREWICDEFVTRRMVPDRAALHVETNVAHPALADVDLETLVASDWAAYEFANRNRKLLGIPPAIPFHVRPRLDVTKLYYGSDGTRKIRECIFKVSWDQKEPNPLGRRFPAQRQVSAGTTLAIDWESRCIRAHLMSDASETQRADRDAILQRLADEGTLQLERYAQAPGGHELQSAIIAETTGDLMRVRGAARMLHILQEA